MVIPGRMADNKNSQQVRMYCPFEKRRMNCANPADNFLIPVHRTRLCFGEENGWWHVVDDLETLRERLTGLFPLWALHGFFSHQETHMIRYPGTYDGYVLCGGEVTADCSGICWRALLISQIPETSPG